MDPSLASLSSLLTPTESNAFHSFLSSMNGISSHGGDKQALAKATKDLMSLDTRYSTPNGPSFASSSSSYSQALLPHPTHSDSSSRTPTPTSIHTSSGRQSSRTRPSHPHPYPASAASKQRRPSSSSAPPKHTTSQVKPALLSPSQKKANHIQSEQKRRANIRRGYDALCECVPELREAVREEEAAAATLVGNDVNNDISGNGTGKRKGKISLKGKDGEDRIDGRAGPRSENVVLSKTIDYINELLDGRRVLLERLHRARGALPSGHPALSPLRYLSTENQGEEDAVPLWEREWTGGQGNLGNTGDGDDDSS